MSSSKSILEQITAIWNDVQIYSIARKRIYDMINAHILALKQDISTLNKSDFYDLIKYATNVVEINDDYTYDIVYVVCHDADIDYINSLTSIKLAKRPNAQVVQYPSIFEITDMMRDNIWDEATAIKILYEYKVGFSFHDIMTDWFPHYHTEFIFKHIDAAYNDCDLAHFDGACRRIYGDLDWEIKQIAKFLDLAKSKGVDSKYIIEFLRKLIPVNILDIPEYIDGNKTLRDPDFDKPESEWYITDRKSCVDAISKLHVKLTDGKHDSKVLEFLANSINDMNACM